jgi:Ca2+-binding RTX toxin-like protein
VVIVGNPQFNFPNDLEKIQPKLQGGGTDQFTLNPDGYISWDLYTPDTAKAWVDTTAGYSSGYSGLTVSIVEVWNSSGTLGTSGAQAIYRIYVANESDNPVQMVNSTNVVVYDIVAASKDKGTVDLINADPLIGNFNSFSNIENAIDKASNGFVTNPPNPYTGTATAEKIWTSASLAGTANAEAAVSADGAGGADAIYGRNNDGLGAGDDALRGGAGNDMLEARAGGDAVYGDAGDDRLFGSLGSDILYGGDGMDVLFGGYGADRLSGGAGADKFVVRLSDRDVITDFNRAEGDRIHLWTGPDVTQADLRYEGGVLWADGTPVVQLLGAPDLVVATDVSIGLRP